MGRPSFVTNEIYHVFNRGVEKRNVVNDQIDSDRFIKSLTVFNRKDPIGSLMEYDLQSEDMNREDSEPLVDIIAYCLNPNHFHLVLRQRVEGGIGEFLKRVVGGYTWFYNYRHDRSGVLFQGRTKAQYVSTNSYLLYVTAYVNLNDRVHNIGGPTAKLVRSSWEEYTGDAADASDSLCTLFPMRQFSSRGAYCQDAERCVTEIAKRRKHDRELNRLLME